MVTYGVFQSSRAAEHVILDTLEETLSSLGLVLELGGGIETLDVLLEVLKHQKL